MNKNMLSGLVMLGVGLLLLFVLIPLGVDTPKKIRYAALSPTYYPQIIALILCLIGAAIALQSWRAPKTSAPAKALEEPVTNTHPRAKIRIALFLGLLAFYAMALNSLGFVICGILVLAASLTLAGERRISIIAPIALLLPILLFLFFYKVAYVPVPNGILAPLLEGF